MKRRDFIKGLSAAVLLIPASSLAQSPSPEAIQKLKSSITSSLEKAIEFDSANPDDIEWFDGFSDGTQCTAVPWLDAFS